MSLQFLNHIEKNQFGVWRYVNYYKQYIYPENRLQLLDGDTLLQENDQLNRYFGLPHLYLKREDQNMVGSFKGRGLAYQVSLAKQRGDLGLVISTSGNAGVALAAYAQQANIPAFICLSDETEQGKLAAMQKYNPIIIKTTRPMRLANYLAVRHGMKNLRPSLDDDSLEGYKSITWEIFEKVGAVEAVFTFVTSGSSLVGMYLAWKELWENGVVDKIPAFFAVQSGDICSVVDIGEEFMVKQDVLAGRLGVKNTHRKNAVKQVLEDTQGSGVYVTDSEIITMKKTLQMHDVIASAEGYAVVAAAQKIQNQKSFAKIVCVLSGTLWTDTESGLYNKIYSVEDFQEADEIVKKYL